MIHNNSSPSEWHHVRSKNNPADLISRGTTPEQLIQAGIWWERPFWLKMDKGKWPKEDEELSSKDIPEMRKQAVIATAVTFESIIDCKKYSSLNKLVRITSYVLRFFYNVRCNPRERKLGPITVSEIDDAKFVIIRIVQAEEFKDDIRALRHDKRVPKGSRLIALNPFLDDQGILRIGGRLKHAVLPDEAKHPIIFPSSHHLTTLVIISHHERLFHAGAQTTLNSIREEFLPILAKNRVKGIIHNCVKCRKANPKASWQIMGQLSSVRVNAARPFCNSEVDYCGPFYVRDRIRRNSKQYKAYVAIFICMATKAVHIELVEDLTTEAFIAALKRFTARRGRIKNIYSDNGRNFVGADRTLQQILEDEDFKKTVQESTSAERINWHFIPARSPHFGGLWESAVRSMKLHLKRTIGEACLTVSEMTTVLTQIESILNSRPLTPLSDDPNDLRAITPGHFLIGENLQAYPKRHVREVAVNRLSRLQHIEQIKQHFWSRWQREYLSTCQQRSKWQTDTKMKFEIGRLVMLKDSESLPLKWVLARIAEVHPDSDGIVRAITVHTEKGTYKRSIVNVSPLLD